MKHYFLITAKVPLPADVMDQHKVISLFMPAADAFRKSVNDVASKEKMGAVKVESAISREKSDDDKQSKPRKARAAAAAAGAGAATVANGEGADTVTGGAGWTPGAGGAPTA